MFAKKASILLIAAAAVSFPLTVAAQGKGVTTTAGKGGVVSIDSLVVRYEPLAGPWSPKKDNPKHNADSLVKGLRGGDPISLYGPMLAKKAVTTTTTPTGPAPSGPPCTPSPTRKCPPPLAAPKPITTTTWVVVEDTITFSSPIGGTGFGNVDIALALAEADVKSKLPGTPLPEQLRAALLGGTVATAPAAANEKPATVTFLGVLELRRQGNGWGEIAKKLDLTLVEK